MIDRTLNLQTKDSRRLKKQNQCQTKRYWLFQFGDRSWLTNQTKTYNQNDDLKTVFR